MSMSRFDAVRGLHRLSESMLGADPELPRSYFEDDGDLVNEDPQSSQTWREWAVRLCGDTPAARESDLHLFIGQRLGGEYEQAVRVVAEMLDAGDIDGARLHLREVLHG